MYEIYEKRTDKRVPNNKFIKTTAMKEKTLENRLFDRMEELFETRKYWIKLGAKGPISKAEGLIWIYKGYGIRLVK